MDFVVAGIARTSDPKELEQILLGCAHLDAQRLAIITKRARTPAFDQSSLQFVHSRGSASMGGGSSITLSSFVGQSSVPHYLEEIAIHRDVALNYNIAIDEGRSVVTYKASEEEAREAEKTFRSCGLVNVKTLRPRSKTITGEA